MDKNRAKTWDSYDYPDLATGNVDYVVPAGTTRLTYYRPYFFSNDGVRSTWQHFYHYFYNGNFPLEAIVSEGDRQELGVFQPETSESLGLALKDSLMKGLLTFIPDGPLRNQVVCHG